MADIAMAYASAAKRLCRRTTIETLPNEVLEQILLNMRASDRVGTALTCRRWAQALSDIVEDIQLVVHGPLPVGSVEHTLMNTERRYKKLTIQDVVLFDHTPNFWEKIGADLLDLKLHNCRFSIEMLYNVFRHCPKLESLDFAGSVILVASTDLLDSTDDRPYLLNLKTLSLTIPLMKHIRLSEIPESELLRPTPDFLAEMIELMPNVVSFSMRERSLGNFSDRMLLPLLLLRQSLVRLDFSNSCVGDETMIQLLHSYSSTLRELKLDECKKLGRETWTAIVECSKLQRLSTRDARNFTDYHLEGIVLAAIDLEFLDLGWCEEVTSEGLEQIHQLKRLRHLVLPPFSNFPKIPRSLGNIPLLQHLDLTGVDSDITTLKRIATLKNLRTLVLRRRRGEISSEILAVICDSFRQLKVLNLGPLAELSDADGVHLSLLTELEDLDIYGYARFTKLTLGSSVLKTLAVTGDVLTDVAIAGIAARQSGLESLALNYCHLLDDGLITLLGHAPHLRRLDLYGCSKLTDRSLEALRSLCPKLKFLRVANCNNTRSAMSSLQRHRPSLVCKTSILRLEWSRMYML